MTDKLRYPLYVTAAPLAIKRLGQIEKALTALHAAGEACPCRKCEAELAQMIERAPDIGWWTGSGMIVCPDCGNKRCPQAESHEYWCTGSNATGQKPAWKDMDPNPRA